MAEVRNLASHALRVQAGEHASEALRLKSQAVLDADNMANDLAARQAAEAAEAQNALLVSNARITELVLTLETKETERVQADAAREQERVRVADQAP